MQDARLVEHLALAREAELLVEGHGLQLRMQVRFAEAPVVRLVQQPAQDRRADATAAHSGNNRDAPDLTGRIKSPGADWFTVQGDQGMDADGVVIVPFLGFRDLLLMDEDFAADLLQRRAVRAPGREHAFYRVVHGGPPRSERAREGLGQARVGGRRQRLQAPAGVLRQAEPGDE